MYIERKKQPFLVLESSRDILFMFTDNAIRRCVTCWRRRRTIHYSTTCFIFVSLMTMTIYIHYNNEYVMVEKVISGQCALTPLLQITHFTEYTVLTIYVFTKRLQQCMLNRGVTVNDMETTVHFPQRDVRQCNQTFKRHSLHSVQCLL